MNIEHQRFENSVAERIRILSNDRELKSLSQKWINAITPHKWAYNFTWLGRPAIQFPNDAWALQELIWGIKPDLIIDCGVAHGGSVIFNASMLALLDICDTNSTGGTDKVGRPLRKTLGIDIEIREHNRKAIEAHPLMRYIELIEGSSVSPDVVQQVYRVAAQHEKILVCLDSNHTHEHVLRELFTYAPLVSIGSYCIVYDTVIEDMTKDLSSDRPWGPGNSPKTAVEAFLAQDTRFSINKDISNKLQITVAPEGYLYRHR